MKTILFHLSLVNKNFRTHLFLLCSMSVLFINCATPQLVNYHSPTITLDAEDTQSTCQQDSTQKDIYPEIDPLQIYKNLIQNSALLSSYEINELDKLEASELKEAIFCLHTVHSYLQSKNLKKSFSEENLFSSETKVTDLETFKENQSLSLEQLSVLFRVDLIENLQKNIFLHNNYFYNFLAKAVMIEQDSILAISVTKLLKEKKTEPNDFQNIILNETNLVNKEDGISPPLPFETDSLKDITTEEIFNNAQLMCEKANYLEGIKLLQTIKEEDLLFDTAQEKIIEISNTAIQEIRKKAAKAFQNAIPVADVKARMTYFQDAKELLTSALSLYPSASHKYIETIKKNLNVINKNIELLSYNQSSSNF